MHTANESNCPMRTLMKSDVEDAARLSDEKKDGRDGRI